MGFGEGDRTAVIPTRVNGAVYSNHADESYQAAVVITRQTSVRANTNRL
jgi:hypothetical protein